MPRLAEEPGRRAAKHERALTVGELRQEAAGGEERRRQVRRLWPATARAAAPRPARLRRPDAGDRGTHVERPGLGEQALDVGLVGQVGARHRRAARRLGTLPAAVIMDDHFGSFGCEKSHTGPADAADAAGAAIERLVPRRLGQLPVLADERLREPIQT